MAARVGGSRRRGCARADGRVSRRRACPRVPLRLELDELTCLLESGSDRSGAVDFQQQADRYLPRDAPATLDDLVRASALVEAGQPIPLALAAAVQHGTSIGGARPKALVDVDGTPCIAKFSSSTDIRPVVRSEGVAMRLAQRAGLDVAPVRLVEAAGRDVLLVERFDRATSADGEVSRLAVVSMLTIVGVSEMSSRHVSYADLAREIRKGPWKDVSGTLRELFGRLVLNLLVGNTDDHLRNTAAFWDGAGLRLAPAYDIAPQVRSTNVASQAIGIVDADQRASQVRLARAVAPAFHLDASEAAQIIDRVEHAVRSGWDEACDEMRLTALERDVLWGREFVNPYCFYDEA